MRKKRKDNKCVSKFCYRTARKRKSKKGISYGKYCTTCDKKLWREKNPMKYAYQNFVSNAKRRKIFCDVTFEQFKQFCYETDYMRGKGKTAKSYSIDRKIEGKKPGYTLSNLQCLPLGVNSQKENARRKQKKLVYDWETKMAFVVKNVDTNNDDEDNPF